MDKVYTGPGNSMLVQMRDNIAKANKIQIAVSFLKESGVKMLAEELTGAINRGAEIEILTSDYLGITEPNALYQLVDILGDEEKIRIYNGNLSFHPKAYFFEFDDKTEELFVGSSNLSKSALYSGVEWNFRLTNEENANEIGEYRRAYFELTNNHSVTMTMEWLREYLKNYRRPVPGRRGRLDIMPESGPFPDEPSEQGDYKNDKKMGPINAQIAGLVELAMTRDEGYEKALTIMATGLGKTYLAAFDSQSYKRILFVAHREEILKQTAKVFERVQPKKSIGFFDGNQKNRRADIILANVSTLGKELYLSDEYFQKDAFDYIVVDEFHHAAAKLYTRVLKYFEPKFLHGLTATPERRDSKDVFHFCDYNIAYQCDFITGINHGWLSPYEYYGIFDNTDYSKIPWRNGRYDIHELQNRLTVDSYMEVVYHQYEIHRRKKGIAFCVGVRHAMELEKYFCDRGVRCKAIHYGCKNREQMVKEFRQGKLDLIFAVDMFNEGFDVPEIDLAMFLRPTESYSIFMQQLGRGLRLSNGKRNVKVLDFVGNYRGFEFVAEYLTGDPKANPIDGPLVLPIGCTAHFDLKLIDEIHQIREMKTPIKDKLIQEYIRIRELLRANPTLVDMLNHSKYPIKLYRKQFDSWMRFQLEMQDLGETGTRYLDSLGEELLVELEKTLMSKSYKIPCIETLVIGGLKESVSIEEIGNRFYFFYQNNRHMRDLNNKNHLGASTWSGKDYEKLAWDNPIHFLSKGSSSKFFICEEKTKRFGWSPKVWKVIQKNKEWFAEEIRQRLEMRSQDYFRRRFYE